MVHHVPRPGAHRESLRHGRHAGALQQRGVKAADVEKLIARIPDKELEIVNNRDMPNICLQHLLAVMLICATVTFKSAHDFRRMRDPKVHRLRSKV